MKQGDPLLHFLSEFHNREVLYDGHQYTCLALLRLLPPLCKQFVLRLLFAPPQSTSKISQGWMNPNAAHSHFTETMSTLSSLGLIAIESHSCSLEPSFSLSLKRGLSTSRGGYPPADAGATHGYEKKWESVLLSVGGASVLPRQLLQSAGLTNKAGQVTNDGFQFLLLGTHAQLWMLLIGHIRDEREDVVGDWLDALLFISLIGVGSVCSKPLPQGLLDLLCKLGVLVDVGAGRWTATPLASALSTLSEEVDVTGWIIVENSFRVYAYTRSPLHIQILGMFMTLETRLPNLVVASLRRDTVRRALSRGITASQILSFLRKNAHPSMLSDRPILPDVVTDQVRAWSQEDDRVFSAGDGALLADFPSQRVFEEAKKVCEDRGVLLWSKSGSLFVKQDSVDMIIDTISKWRV